MLARGDPIVTAVIPGRKTVPIDHKRLRRERKRLGLTQWELARRCGWTQGRVWAYERGKKRPTVASLRRLEEALDIERDWL